ncbi:MAG: YgcG family protein [Burkholderiales bacterium]|nr:YgcG family protein [Burkholderiales bacterium]
MRRTRFAWGFALLAFALTATLAQAWQAGRDGLVPIPSLRERVTDLTQTLSPQQSQALVAKLAAWEARTGNQLAVLLVPTTQPESIEAYGIRVAEAWKIGRKGHDNGALLIVAKNDRKLRIEVGYGLEGTLTDAASRRIIGDVIAPYFRQNQFDKGVEAGVDAIIATVDKDPGAIVAPSASSAPAVRDLGDVPVILLFFLFVVVPAVGGVLRRLFGRVFGTILGSGVAGVGTWLLMGSIAFGIIAAVLALIVLLFAAGTGSGLASRGGGVWLPPGSSRGGGGGGGWSSGGGGGGGFSGGGGSFGGGGASGSW